MVEVTVAPWLTIHETLETQHGIAQEIERLTNSQGRFLAAHARLDARRNRIAQARFSRGPGISPSAPGLEGPAAAAASARVARCHTRAIARNDRKGTSSTIHTPSMAV
jgi:hypothetical protein